MFVSIWRDVPELIFSFHAFLRAAQSSSFFPATRLFPVWEKGVSCKIKNKFKTTSLSRLDVKVVNSHDNSKVARMLSRKATDRCNRFKTLVPH